MGTTDKSTTQRGVRISSKYADEVATAKLVDLVAAGAPSVAAAAEAAGITHGVANRLLQQEFRRYYEERAAQRDEMVGQTLRKFDLLESALWPRALKADEKAVDRILAVIKARNEMLGLNAPSRVDVQVNAVDEAVAKIGRIVEGAVSSAEVVPLRRMLPEAG
jgi:hypothetical protein